MALKILILGFMILFPTWQSYAQEEIRIVPDHRIKFGELENGMKYAILPNSKPTEEVSINLYFRVGSLHENDNEQGYAHFVEHMAFNGSKNIPENEFVRILERFGLSFGADVNAYTYFDKTVYKLDLPDVKEETIDTALMLFRETASNLIFDEEAVIRERGVVLAEYNVSKSDNLDLIIKKFKIFLPDSRIPKRIPIGTPDHIKNADSTSLRAFYDAFYRPENAFLVVVGDINLDQMEAKIAEYFEDWYNQSPVRDSSDFEPLIMEEKHQETFATFNSPQVVAEASISFMHPFIKHDDTFEYRKKLFFESLSRRILSARFKEISQSNDAPFSEYSISSVSLFKEAEKKSILLITTDDDLLKALALAEQELRRLLRYGFTKDEIDREITNLRIRYEDGVENAANRSNGWHISDIIDSHHEDYTFIHPELELEIFESAVKDITPERLTNIFRDNWKGKSIYFATTTKPTEGIEQALVNAVDASQIVAVAPPEDLTVEEFAYTDFGPAGEIIHEHTETDPEYTKIRFANNVMLNIKHTDYLINKAFMTVRFGGGVISFPKEPSGLSVLAPFGFILGGLEKHSTIDIERLLSGTTVSTDLSLELNVFFMTSVIKTKDMLKQLQVSTAYLTAPAFRPEVIKRYRKEIESVYHMMRSSPYAALSYDIYGYILKEPRLSLAEKEHLLSLTMDELKQAMLPSLQKGPVEITIIGDVNIEEVKHHVAQTLGALPSFLEMPDNQQQLKTIKFAPDKDFIKIYHTGKPDQALLKMYWPTTDNKDVALDAKLRMLGNIMDSKIRELVREKESISYSTDVSSLSSDVIPDFGMFTVQADLTPEDFDQVENLFLRVVEDVRTNLVTEDELTRALNPILNYFKNIERPQEWMGILQRAQTAPETVSNFFIFEDEVKKVTAEQILEVANIYLNPENLFKVHVVHDPESSK